jgi:hypothetical protein
MMTNLPDPAVPVSQRKLSRRQILRRAVGMSAALLGVEAIAAGAVFLNPPVRESYSLGRKASFPSALPKTCSVASGRGVFVIDQPKCFVIHLAAETVWQETGNDRKNHIDYDLIHIDMDGSYWLVLSRNVPYYQGHLLDFQECNQTFIDRWRGDVYDILGDQLYGGFSTYRFPVQFNHDTLTIPYTPVKIDDYLNHFPYENNQRELHRLSPIEQQDPYCPNTTTA